MFSAFRHRQYQAGIMLITMYNQLALRGHPMTEQEQQEHQKLIADRKAYEETLNYKFFLTLGQIRHSKAMAAFYYAKRRISERLACIAYDLKQIFNKKA